GYVRRSQPATHPARVVVVRRAEPFLQERLLGADRPEEQQHQRQAERNPPPPRATGSPQSSVASQPTSKGAPIATGGQSRNATVSLEPCTMPSLSRVGGGRPGR